MTTTSRRLPVLLRPVLAVLSALSVLALLFVAAPQAQAALPSKATWEQDVRTAMKGANAYLRDRIASKGKHERLAINLDIDNTSLASHYDDGAPVGPTFKLARIAHRNGVAVFFNTGRQTPLMKSTRAQLERAGYTVDRLCMRAPGEALKHSKQSCRQGFIDAGYTLVENIGNNPTDFAGKGYERAFKLPNYDGQLS